MRRLNKGGSPPKLAAFVANNPSATWSVIRKNGSRYAQIRKFLFEDQQSLCAYCEIRLIIDESNPDSSDFRVEHFHPKSPHVVPPNYAAMWLNMLGCCHGGAHKSVPQPGRFSAPDLSCDALKANQNLVGVILNPLSDFIGSDMLFSFSVDGSISVSPSCPGALQASAGETIVHLGLDSNRLRRLRREAIEATLDAIADLNSSGVDLEEACTILFPNQAPPEFYSCMRSVLGAVAEARLTQLNYYQ